MLMNNLDCFRPATGRADTKWYTRDMPESHKASFTCDTAQVRPAALWVERASAELGLNRDDTRRLALILEELFANTLHHGAHRPGKEIAVRLAREDGAVRLEYRDPGEAFDPLSVEVPDAPDLDSWPIGGLGLRLIRRFAERADYRFEDGVNIVSVSLKAD